MIIPGKPTRIKDGARLQRTNKVEYQTLEEVEQLHKDGKAMKHTFKVRGKSQDKYIVTHQENQWSCTCPDFQYNALFPGQLCKHIMAVIMEMGIDETRVTPEEAQTSFETKPDESVVYVEECR